MWLSRYEIKARKIVANDFPGITEKSAAPKVDVIARLLKRFGIDTLINTRCL